MRWFAKLRRSDGMLPTPKLLSREDALELYKMTGHGRFGVLNSVERMMKGKYAQGISYEIWGEELSDKELFLRILDGKLKPQEKV